MKIAIREIPSAGLEFSKEVPLEEIGLSPEDVESVRALNVVAKVERVGDTVLAHAKIKGKFSFVCSRCLETVERDDLGAFDFDYKIEKGVEAIDLGEDIRQELILSQPSRILCRDDCQGLCAGCGANLNKEKCKCSNDSRD